MTDALLDRLVADARPVSDAWVASLDLRHAEAELMDEVMASNLAEGGLDPSRPPSERRRPGRRIRFRAAVAVAAAVATAVAAVLVVRGATDDPSGGRTNVAVDGPTEVPRLLADWVPDGYELSGVSDPSENGGTIGPDLIVGQIETLYGDQTAADPFASSDLRLTVTLPESDMHTEFGDKGAERVEVRGHPGQICRPARCGGSTGTNLIWDEAPGMQVSLGSASLDPEQVLAIAEGLSVDGNAVELGSLPAGLPGPLDLMSRGQVPLVRPEYSATYLSDDDARLTVSSVAGDEHDLLSQALAADSRRRVEVRGHQGWLLTYRWGFAPRLIWLEAPGVVVSVVVSVDGGGEPGMGEADLLAVADSLRVATDEEWAAALHDDGPVPVEEVESYIPADAVAFVTTDLLGMAAYLTTDGQVCAFLVTPDGKQPDMCGPESARVHELRDASGELVLLFGTMPEGAMSVEITSPEAMNPASAFHDVVSEAGPLLYAYPTAIFVPETLEFLDGNGQPVETVTYP